jgi:hypothetical protein
MARPQVAGGGEDTQFSFLGGFLSFMRKNKKLHENIFTGTLCRTSLII